MIRYLLIVPINIIWMLICFILNPFVVLFSDKEGNYPKWLIWFSTHDNSADGDKDHQVRCPGDRLYQIYYRRVRWLYRNKGYYFRYHVLGYNSPGRENMIIKGNENIRNTPHPPEEGFCFAYDKSKNILTRGWMLYVIKRYGFSRFPKLGVRIYLGWKFMGFKEGQKMFAWHFSPWKSIG